MSDTPEKPDPKKVSVWYDAGDEMSDMPQSKDPGEPDVLRCAIMKALMDEQVLNALCEQILSGVMNIIKPQVDSHINEQLTRAVDSKVTDLNREIATKNSEIAMLKDRVTKLEVRAEEQEQYSRRTCLRFSNVPYQKEDGSIPESPWAMNTDKIVFEICEKVGVKVTEKDIGRSHIVGEPVNGKCQIIARFLSYGVRQNVYENRFKLKKDEKKRFINEDLTKYRFRIVQHLANLRRQRKIYQHWTQDGRIFIRLRSDGRKMLIRSIREADELIARFNE
ncbi:hypothetical protein FSP39_008247 [Pinctada imbricata]|uniref:Uncharacterized protein n=1 Tax=Pinctada imbricata TaxID=66713 RepID=A0AA88XMY0_PINIB|nr:hypothetical protein FSP39_008247 [Pinctada imbricata]